MLTVVEQALRRAPRCRVHSRMPGLLFTGCPQCITVASGEAALAVLEAMISQKREAADAER